MEALGGEAFVPHYGRVVPGERMFCWNGGDGRPIRQSPEAARSRATDVIVEEFFNAQIEEFRVFDGNVVGAAGHGA